jgi:hypothetical protein
MPPEEKEMSYKETAQTARSEASLCRIDVQNHVSANNREFKKIRTEMLVEKYTILEIIGKIYATEPEEIKFYTIDELAKMDIKNLNIVVNELLGFIQKKQSEKLNKQGSTSTVAEVESKKTKK